MDSGLNICGHIILNYGDALANIYQEYKLCPWSHLSLYVE